MRLRPLSLLCLVATGTFAASTAQTLANTERELASRRTTKDPLGSLEEEVSVLGATWLREELSASRSLGPGPRAVRQASIVAEASRRGLGPVQAEAEALLEPTLAAWFVEAHALLKRREPLRAVALRRATLGLLPPRSRLVDFDRAIETEAQAQVVAGLDAAKGPGARFAWATAGGLLLGLTGKAEPALSDRLVPRGTVTVDVSACPLADPGSLANERGVSATRSLTVQACPTRTTSSTEQRSASYVVKELVERPVVEKVMEEQEVETIVSEQVCIKVDKCTQNTSTSYDGHSITRESCSAEDRCYMAPVVKKVKKMVEVERTRMVQQLEDVTKYEPYQVRIVTTSTSATAKVSIEGDGAQVALSETLETRFVDEEYRSTHGGSHSLGPDPDSSARAGLAALVQAIHGRAVMQWRVRRAAALRSGALSLDDAVTATLLSQTLEAAVLPRLAEAGLSAAEARALIDPSVALERPALPGSAVTLPAPDGSLVATLETMENKARVMEMQGGFGGGLHLGITTQDPLDRSGGLARFGFGAGFIMQLELTSQRSLLVARAAVELHGAIMDFVQLDGAARFEFGVRFGPRQASGLQMFTVVGLGLTHLALSFDGEHKPENTAYRWPLTFAAGYGGRVEVLLGPIGLGVMLARLHREVSDCADASSAVCRAGDPVTAPLGTRAEARLFYDLGGVVRIVVGARINTLDDVPKLFSTPSRSWFSYAGLQSEF